MRADHEFAREDHRAFRPAGWVEAGLERIELMRPVAERYGLTPIQLACQWDLAHAAVACVAPTLIQESGAGARTIESKRAELSALPAKPAIKKADVTEIRPDRGQHGLHGTERGGSRPRGRGSAGSLADHERTARARGALAD